MTAATSAAVVRNCPASLYRPVAIHHRTSRAASSRPASSDAELFGSPAWMTPALLWRRSRRLTASPSAAEPDVGGLPRPRWWLNTDHPFGRSTGSHVGYQIAAQMGGNVSLVQIWDGSRGVRSGIQPTCTRPLDRHG